MGNLDSEIVDEIARVLCTPEDLNIKELGIFFGTEPLANPSCSDALDITTTALGIASWALSPIYIAAKHRLSSSREDIHAATALLVVNPDYMTAWSVRKEQLSTACEKVYDRNCAQAVVARELSFVSLILRRNPKSAETWSHRSWILQNHGWDSTSINEELRVCELAASSASCNYYAGVHRLKTLRRSSENVVSSEILKNRLWLQLHVSDSSGWWYHIKAVECGMSTGLRRTQDMVRELAFAADMLQRYGKGYENVRRYHKWLLNTIGGESSLEHVKFTSTCS